MAFRLNPRFLTFFILIIIISSCKFEPAEVDYTEVKQNKEIPKVTIDLSSTSDTIALFEPTNIEFQFSAGNAKFDYALLVIDGNVIDTNFSPNSYFYLSPKQEPFKLGYHELRILFFVDKETGSLANQLGMEHFIYEIKKVIVVIDKYDTPYIVSAYPENGMMKISWNSSMKNYVDHYIIQRMVNSTLIDVGTADKNKNYFYDENYCGKETDYYVVASLSNKLFYSMRYHVENTIPVMEKVSDIGNNSIKVEWEKTPYYKNFKAYRLFFNAETIAITDINQTSHEFKNLEFGNLYPFKLTMIMQGMSLDFNDPNYQYSSTSYLSLGDEFPDLPDNINFTKNYLIGYNAASIKIYDPEKNIIEESITEGITSYSKFANSLNGRYILVTDNMLQKYICLDRETNRTSNFIANILGSSENIEKISISNNGIAAFYSYSSNKVYLYDFQKHKLLGNIDASGYQMEISPDGKYLVTYIESNRLVVYDLTNGLIRKKWWDGRESISITGKICFLSDYQNRLVFNYDSDYFIVDLDNMNLAGSYKIPSDFELCNIDNAYNYLLLHKYKKLFVFDVSTFNQIGSPVPVNYFSTNMYFLHNNYIYNQVNNLRIKL